MTRSKYLIGISAVALTTAIGAGTASAQQNTNNITCPQNGGVNTCAVNQGSQTNENSSDVAVLSGTNNFISIDQQNGTLNASTARVSGSNNVVIHQQRGVLNTARTDITGNTNVSIIRQNGTRNSATHTITGNNNSATSEQSNGANANGTSNSSTITITGNRISSSVNQNGIAAVPTSANRAVILAQNPDVAGNAADPSANAQTNQIFQSERGNSATIANSGGTTSRGTGGANGSGELRATITQRNTLFGETGTGTLTLGAPTATSNPSTGNQAVIRLSGVAHSASVTQDGVLNNADVNINRGVEGVSQAAGVDAGTGLTVDASNAGMSGGNSATITQTGRANRTLVSMGFPVGQGSPQQGLGNRLILNQTNVNTTLQGHSSTVYQFGQLSTVSITQTNNNLGAGGAVQGNSNAIVSQGSFFSSISLTQSGSNDADLNQSGGRGEAESGRPAANGTGGQSGNNSLTVTQTDTGDLGGSGSTANEQPGAFDPAPSPGVPPTAARNFASVSQAGRNNSGTIAQNATRASATLFQRRGSANLVANIQQGTGQGFGNLPVAGTGGAAGATRVTARVNQGGLSGLVEVRQDGDDLTATVNQNNTEFSTEGRLQANGGAAGTVAPVVQISQVGAFNQAEVTQNGSNSTATVDQRNVNTAGNISNVVIGQNGGNAANGGNVATARQTRAASGTATIGTGQQTGPGTTIDPATRTAGNTTTNQIEIRQTNTGTSTAGGVNSATVEQRGSGQIGRIFQNGSDNIAGILQEITATNSTAIIDQTGRGNRFFITQNDPNSFLRVTQTGANNQTVVLGSGGANNGGGSTSTTVVPAFTPTP
jgi:hypothetical protein